jgi:cytochrome c oxidase assembly protein Cox11
MPSRRLRWVLGIGAGALLAGALVVGWWMARSPAPVRVTFNSQVIGPPVDVEPVPAELSARPGKMQRVVFRVHNSSSEVRRLKGSVALKPPAAVNQVKIFAMQCGDYALVQPGETREFAVVFRVDAPGQDGLREIAMRHIFQPAEPRP